MMTLRGAESELVQARVLPPRVEMLEMARHVESVQSGLTRRKGTNLRVVPVVGVARTKSRCPAGTVAPRCDRRVIGSAREACDRALQVHPR
jgi:hypothetical protein